MNTSLLTLQEDYSRMAHKRIRRLVMVLCPNCLGTGTVEAKGDERKCPECNGKGEIEKWIVEIVHDDDDD